jgi:hypothetical protein
MTTLKKFLGMAGHYHLFIPELSRLATIREGAKFIWTEDWEYAFRVLKSKFITQLILQYPDFSNEFV